MEEKVFNGTTEEEVWQQLEADLSKEETVLEYTALLIQNNRKVVFDIDVDLGGGFESGYAFTTFAANLLVKDGFRFAIHEDTFLDEAGKLFGMQDVVIGYPEFDDKVIIKTNNEEKVKLLFDSEEVREALKALNDFSLHIESTDHQDNGEQEQMLVLKIEDAFTNTNALRKTYHAFYKLLLTIESV